MRAITIAEPGDPSVLTVSDVAELAVGPGEVAIEVVAAGVNRADLLQRQGLYAPPAGESAIPGLEVSGRIKETGAGVTSFSVGDEVCALLTGGGYAETVVVSAEQVLPVPAGLDLVDAAGLPEVVCTVFSNVFMSAGLHPGEWLLVHGGGSGIGTAAIQITKALGGHVAVTAGSSHKLDFCRELGADVTINYREQDFVQEIKGASDGRGADVILDVMGAKYLERNIESLNVSGRLVIIGLQGGRKSEIDLNEVMRRRLAVIGTTLRARPAAEKATIVAAVREQVWPLIEDGSVLPIIHSRLAFDQAPEAHQILEDGENIGKVLLVKG
ncbi:NAD(P)H-quinone oxidoreductase [Saxibacter everestensis]|uniref:NAD(P)H-quinone oxidoreductase n=1 Tax=Saxibacter everestensis TaxID=2909229 RepID=A0ABY8QSK0_9MICO|nr:NAD(P)H-quinone oxidoreductase [Brevibacteriaceae bacterium ZFBP1038]